ncbi:NAD-dependent epimerase/dehydratase family protein [Aliarcobacter butzleri]|uniref:NAD-dependent epimerase/dehydratase family protein n=1 Tax=Aliarcobacter butzleri TaxID=28197 RepID=UPI003AF98C25
MRIGLEFDEGNYMIIGSGLLAKAFLEYENNDRIIIFASGVSNSKEILRDEFNREEKLLDFYLEKYGKNKHFVYFSTCSIYDTYFERSEYTRHKINMEEIIIKKGLSYNIFRLPQVLGKNNKNQLIGFLYESIKMEKSFELFDIERNIIDIQDVFILVDKILKENIFKNEVINIANPKNIKVLDLIDILEKMIDKKAKYNIVKKTGEFIIDIKNIELIISDLDIFEKNYVENRITKYYE